MYILKYLCINGALHMLGHSVVSQRIFQFEFLHQMFSLLLPPVLSLSYTDTTVQ